MNNPQPADLKKAREAVVLATHAYERLITSGISGADELQSLRIALEEAVQRLQSFFPPASPPASASESKTETTPRVQRGKKSSLSEEGKKRLKAWKAANPDKVKAASQRQRAKKRTETQTRKAAKQAHRRVEKEREISLRRSTKALDAYVKAAEARASRAELALLDEQKADLRHGTRSSRFPVAGFLE